MTTCSPPPVDAISFAAAAELVRIDGRPVSPVTVWRWARKGRLGVRLVHWKRGRQYVTTPEAVQEFEAEVSRRDAQRLAERTGEHTPDKLEDVDARAAALGV
ncbi:MAG: DUF1580 domain-containing protein [Phycisphaeraceae bacterium]